MILSKSAHRYDPDRSKDLILELLTVMYFFFIFKVTMIDIK